MERSDEALIAALSDQLPELKSLVEAHRDYERQLDEISRRPYLSTEEQVFKKQLQKEKLLGKDRIEAILAQHRKN